MEQLEPLGKNIKVFVDETYHFTTDTILIANYASPKSSDKVCDLGTGCGTIPLIFMREAKPKEITAIDIQSDAIDLFNKSIEYNKITNITTIVSDINDLKGKVEFGSYDLVVCNPPYKLKGTGIENPDDKKALINHETNLTLDDICKTASKLLNYQGRFIICQRPERLTDVLLSLRENDLEPKRVRFVQQRDGKCPKLFLVEARKSGNQGFMVVEPTLFIEDENGKFSKEMINIYGDYKEE